MTKSYDSSLILPEHLRLQNGNAPHDDPSIEFIDVTPEIALRWLELNATNRRVSDAHVRGLAQDMRNGDWKLDAAPIRFDANGLLIDGQHRLWAITQAGVTIRLAVAFNVDSSAVETVDTGRRRTLSDTLKMRGEKNHIQLASVLLLVMRWESGRIRDNTPISTTAALRRFEQDPDALRSAASHASTVVTKMRPIRVPVGPVGACWLRFHELSNEDARVFFAKFGSGISLEDGDPIYALRRRFENHSAVASRRTQGVHRLDAHAWLIKGWNAFMRGDTVRSITWRRGGASPEQFPEPIGPVE